jgi:uncharacterized membrane protein YdjX (TVP38/TMEM64 family)
VKGALTSNREQGRAKKALIVLLFCSGIALFFLLNGPQYLTMESLLANRSKLIEFTSENLFAMWFGWALMFSVVMLFGLPLGALLSLATGLIFGRWNGTLLLVLAGTLSAVLVFLTARYVFAESARKKMEQYPFTARILDGFHTDAFHYMLFLRLVPLFPFWPVNLVPAFTKITTRTFISATLIGMVPGSFIFASLGHSLRQVDRLDQLFSLEMMASLAALGMLALLPIVIKRL